MTHKFFGKSDKAHYMTEKLAILDHLYIHRDVNPNESFRWQTAEERGEEPNYSQYGYPVTNLPNEMTRKVIKYIVEDELEGSPNDPSFDSEYFMYIYTQLFMNEINTIRQESIEEGRTQLKNELKRRVRDDPDLLRKIKVA